MTAESFTIFTAGIATLAIFSFLIKENPVYRFFEHLFIGIASGFGIILTVKNFLWPKIIMPMIGADIYHFPDGTLSKEPSSYYLLYLIPAAFGLLYYFIYSQKYNWLAKLVIGFSLGAAGGLAFKGFFNQILPQITGSFKPLVVFENGTFSLLESLNNILFITILVLVMYYFFFSFRHENKQSGRAIQVGRMLLMVCFGAFFGSTVMARMALLVERLQFLLNDWL